MAMPSSCTPARAVERRARAPVGGVASPDAARAVAVWVLEPEEAPPGPGRGLVLQSVGRGQVARGEQARVEALRTDVGLVLHLEPVQPLDAGRCLVDRRQRLLDQVALLVARAGGD